MSHDRVEAPYVSYGGIDFRAPLLELKESQEQLMAPNSATTPVGAIKPTPVAI